MPAHTPKILGNVEPLLREKLNESLANREKVITILSGVSMKEADRTLHKLRAMRAGLKQYQPEGSELQMLAAKKHIRFSKTYSPGLMPDKRHSVFICTYAVEVERPSDAVKQSIADFYAGKRSTPF